jgi:hypothetical protein
MTEFVNLVLVGSKKYKWTFKFFLLSYFAYSEIWLNLPLDDHHITKLIKHFLINDCKVKDMNI